MLDWCDGIDECIVSIINVNKGMKEPTNGYQYYSTNQKLTFGEVLKVNEFLYTCASIWVKTILNHCNLTWV